MWAWWGLHGMVRVPREGHKAGGSGLAQGWECAWPGVHVQGQRCHLALRGPLKPILSVVPVRAGSVLGAMPVPSPYPLLMAASCCSDRETEAQSHGMGCRAEPGTCL